MARLEVLELRGHSTFIYVREHYLSLVSFIEQAQGLKSLKITLDVGASIVKTPSAEPRWPNLNSP